MPETMREFMKGGANIHVREHYRMHNGKLIYVAAHDKAMQVGTEAQLHERVQHAKNPAHLMTIDPEDRDAVLKHANQLGIKADVKYQGGKIRDHEGNVKPHGFHYVKFGSEDDAKKVHAALSGSKQEDKPADTPAQQADPEQPEEKIKEKIETHPNDAVKEAESKLQAFISMGHSSDIQKALSGVVSAEKGIELADQGLELAQAAVDAAEAYEKETGQAPPNKNTYHDIVAKLNTWKAQLQEKSKPVETAAEPDKKQDLLMTDSVPDTQSDANKSVHPNAIEYITQTVFKGKSLNSAVNDFMKKFNGHENTFLGGYVDYTKEQLVGAYVDKKADGVIKGLQHVKEGKGSMVLKFACNEFKVPERKLAEAVAKKTGGKNENGVLNDFPDLVNKVTPDKKQEPENLQDVTKEEPTAEAKPEKKAEHQGGPKKAAHGELAGYMEEAEKNFHSDPHKAIEALKQGAELAEKHGISYTHGNGKTVDAAWMNETAAKMEAAVPKAPDVDEEYTKAAKEATEASGLAHTATQGNLKAQEAGEFTPENAKAAMMGHQNTGMYHVKAKAAHNEAAQKAPTPELKKFHENKAAEHDQHATVHNEAAKMHEKEHKKNVALKNYVDKKKDADAASAEADKFSVGSEDPTHHDAAAFTHEGAAKGHKEMIQHALSVGVEGERKANEHAAKATEHEKKAAYHKAAKEAWKATNEDGENPAAKHSKAAQAAEEAGLKDAAAKHDEQSAKHVAYHKAKQGAEASKPAEPANPWKGQDANNIAAQGNAAYHKGDWAEAMKHYKHAAVVAHHNGDEHASTYAKMAKDAMAKAAGK